MQRGRYILIQGILIGVMIWGAVSVGLRYIHYAYEKPIPKVMMAPGKTMGPLLKEEDKERFALYKQQLKTHPTALDKAEKATWEAVKEFVGFLANLITIVMPIFSGLISFMLWRKQSRMLPEGGSK